MSKTYNCSDCVRINRCPNKTRSEMILNTARKLITEDLPFSDVEFACYDYVSKTINLERE